MSRFTRVLRLIHLPIRRFFRRRRKLKIALCLFLATLFLLIAGIVFVFRPYSFGNPPRIPSGWGTSFAPKFKGRAASPLSIAAPHTPKHPFLADTNSSNMHVDAYASDVHRLGGPLGHHPEVQSYAHARFGGECACVTFDSNGNIVAVCGTFKEFALLLISPRDLRPLAKMSLPGRASNKTLNLRKIMSDTSGGAYFFLDKTDQAVLVDAEQCLRVIAQTWTDGTPSFVNVARYPLRPLLEEHTDESDVVTSVLPDWTGQYWFVSRKGLVGILDPDTGEVHFVTLDGEEIQNSFAVDQHGAYVVSDRALYGLRIQAVSGQPEIVWREEYQTASSPKTGSITRGSGTTPTLLGDDLVAIADNADSQINVVVYRRQMNHTGRRLVCKVPVFAPGQSATENTMIGIGRSLIIENNYGYDLFTTMMFGKTGAGGIARIDIAPDLSGAEVVWENPIISQTTVPKLSMDTGLVYVYAKDPSVGWGVDAYYLAAIDFQTGKTVFQVLTGTGVSFDNNWAPITLGPDRSAYIGVLRGLVKVADGGGDNADTERQQAD